MSKDCSEWKYGIYKKFEEAEKAIDKDEDDVVLCSLTMENKKDNVKKRMDHGRCKTALQCWYACD